MLYSNQFVAFLKSVIFSDVWMKFIIDSCIQHMINFYCPCTFLILYVYLQKITPHTPETYSQWKVLQKYQHRMQVRDSKIC